MTKKQSALKAKDEPFETFDRPAKIMPFHVVVNPEDVEQFQRWEAKDETPLGVALDKGKLSIGGCRTFTGVDRYKAACVYRSIYDTVYGSQCAGQNYSGAGGGGGQNGMRSSETLVIARQLRDKLEAELSKNALYILRAFICEGSTGSQAVKSRCEGFRDENWAYICSLLDELCDAVVLLGLAGRVSRET